jgi:hypothetical protein
METALFIWQRLLPDAGCGLTVAQVARECSRFALTSFAKGVPDKQSLAASVS